MNSNSQLIQKANCRLKLDYNPQTLTQMTELTEAEIFQGVEIQYVNLLFTNKAVQESTFKRLFILYTVVACCFLGIGGWILYLNLRAPEVEISYYSFSNNQCIGQTNCVVPFKIERQLIAPIRVSLKVSQDYPFYNLLLHQVDWPQFSGVKTDCQFCAKYRTNAEMGVTKSFKGAELNSSAVASPCGLIGTQSYYLAKKFFLDTYRITNEKSTITISTNDLVPESVRRKYQPCDDAATTQWVDVTSDAFIVWMENSGLPNERLIRGWIKQNLPTGSYTLTVAVSLTAMSKQNTRQLVLTSSSLVGSRNVLAPCALLAVGLFFVFNSIYIAKKVIFGQSKRYKSI